MDGGIDNKELLRQQALSQFNPLIPINFNKDYTLYIVIITLIMMTIQNNTGSFVGYLLIHLAIILCTSYIHITKLYRQGYLLTMSGCLAADTISFFISALWLIIINDKSAIVIISKLFFISISSVTAQSLVHMYIRNKEKRKLNNIKAVEKQRQKYENKVNKIFKYKS